MVCASLGDVGGNISQEGGLVFGDEESRIAPRGAEPEVLSHDVASQTGASSWLNDAHLGLPVHQDIPRVPRVVCPGDDGDL